MPYDTLVDLPSGVRDSLPEQAQEIYRASYYSAWDEYGHDEARAHRVAWSAVERKYHKNDAGEWVNNRP